MVLVHWVGGDGHVEVVVSQRPLPVPQLRGATFQIQETFSFPSPEATVAVSVTKARGHGQTPALRC